MTDPAARAVLDVLVETVIPAHFTDENLLYLVICRMVNLSLDHGNSDGSCISYVWLGRRQKGVVFLVVLSLMFAIGLMLQGRIFPFEFSEPLVALAAVADIGLGVPWMLARMVGAGAGLVTAATYEYGNSFLIVAGLLNFLVILDAFDIAMGRK